MCKVELSESPNNGEAMGEAAKVVDEPGAHSGPCIPRNATTAPTHPVASRPESETAGAEQRAQRKDEKPVGGEEIAAQFKRALVLHQAGRLAEAEQGYQAILRASPGISTVCTCWG